MVRESLSSNVTCEQKSLGSKEAREICWGRYFQTEERMMQESHGMRCLVYLKNSEETGEAGMGDLGRNQRS